MFTNEETKGIIRVGGKTEEIVQFILNRRTEVLQNFLAWDDQKIFCDEKLIESLKFVLNDVRQGIYVLFRLGRPRLIVSMCNTFYKNTFVPIAKYVTGETYEERRKKRKNWVSWDRCWASNGILCTTPVDHDLGWGNGMLVDIRNTLENVSREHNIKDDEFFINRRDLPMLKKDGTSCYYFAGAKNPKHQCFLKVYSLYQGKDWLDLPFIEPSTETKLKKVEWKKKKNTAFFRGSSTGVGTNAFSNKRIKLAKVASLHWHDEVFGEPLMDIGLVSLSRREKIVSVFEKYVLLDNDNIQHVPYLKEKVPIVEWSNWKYLIYAEGYSAALRFFPMLSSGSVIIFIKGQSTANQLWFFKYVKFIDSTNITDDGHVIFLENIEDLENVLIFLRKNDTISEKIATNAYQLYKMLLKCRHKFLADEINNN